MTLEKIVRCETRRCLNEMKVAEVRYIASEGGRR